MTGFAAVLVFSSLQTRFLVILPVPVSLPLARPVAGVAKEKNAGAIFCADADHSGCGLSAHMTMGILFDKRINRFPLLAQCTREFIFPECGGFPCYH